MKRIVNNTCRLLIGLLILIATGCSKDTADAPTIKVFVNNAEVVDSKVPVKISAGEVAEYRFEIRAYATIADIKTIIFDVLSPTIKVPSETLVGGLTNSLNETVKGVVYVNDDTEVMVVVKDLDGNEVSKSFGIAVQ